MIKADFSEPVRLTESEIESAAGTLARAFYDYPLFSYVFPDTSKRKSELPFLLQEAVHYGVLNGEVYATSRNLEGVAVCGYHPTILTGLHRPLKSARTLWIG